MHEEANKRWITLTYTPFQVGCPCSQNKILAFFNRIDFGKTTLTEILLITMKATAYLLKPPRTSFLIAVSGVISKESDSALSDMTYSWPRQFE